MRYLIAKYLKGESFPSYLGYDSRWYSDTESAYPFEGENALKLALELNATVVPVNPK